MGFAWDIECFPVLSTHQNRTEAHLEIPAETPSFLDNNEMLRTGAHLECLAGTPSFLDNNEMLEFCTASIPEPLSEQ